MVPAANLRRSILRSIQGPNLLGGLAVGLGLITQDQLRAALEEQALRAAGGEWLRLGHILLSAGFLTRLQLEQLLDMQEAAALYKFDMRIGEIAIQNGFLRRPQLKEALREQRAASGKLLGEVLVRLGYLTPEQVKALLVAQKRVTAEHGRVSVSLAITEFPLGDGESWTIGRAPECQIVLPDLDVAHLHAKITLRDGAFLLEDLGGLAGTWLDGERIDKPMPLRSGAVIVLGGTVAQFRSEPFPGVGSVDSRDTKLVVRSRPKEQDGKGESRVTDGE